MHSNSYISVALSVHFRSHLLDVESDEDILPALQGLVGTMSPLLDSNDPLEVVDDILGLTLKYMERIPPSSLMQSCLRWNNSKTRISPPIWATAAAAPTDYAVLKHVKELRGKTTETAQTNESNDVITDRSIDNVGDEEGDADTNPTAIADSHVDSVDQFPKAAIAAGIVPVDWEPAEEKTPPGQSWSSTTVLLLAILFVAFGAMIAVTSGLLDVSDNSQKFQQVTRDILEELNSLAKQPDAKLADSPLGKPGSMDVDSPNDADGRVVKIDNEKFEVASTTSPSSNGTSEILDKQQEEAAQSNRQTGQRG